MTEEAVLAIHADQFGEFGGAQGLSNPGLLSSALAQPLTTFDGKFLHRDLYEMAAAYLFHIIKNHPFIDGNKRTALIAALTFLDLNGVNVESDAPNLYELTIGVAESRIGKNDAAEALRRFFPDIV